MKILSDDELIRFLRIADRRYLAPQFDGQVTEILARMAERGHPAKVVETIRVQRLQDIYHARGTTNAADVWSSWHPYGLAADIVHATREWAVGESFWQTLGEEANRVGAAWGGMWKTIRDTPHVQFGPGMRVSPKHAKTIVEQGGVFAVWRTVGAA